MTMPTDLQTPFEQGNGNQTTTWEACIAFYFALAERFPNVLRFLQIGVSDAGVPLHAGIVSADGVFERERIKSEARPVFFNNNGIHPGEPEGVDACMALVRDFCVEPARLAALGRTVFLFVPLYNVDGSINRANTSRVNQDGPEAFGFRGNSRHLDLNRDFIKCDSLNARLFNQLFVAWDPDVMVDTHTSNGADYPYTMTLIHTQADKLGGELGAFLRAEMLPEIYRAMEARGWPVCPYVNPIKDSPDQGIAEFLEVPRFPPATRPCITPLASCRKPICSSRLPTATQRCVRWWKPRWALPSRMPNGSRACGRPHGNKARSKRSGP
jgi:hypothetical protein